MRVLVACEESGTVRRAFRALGHDAWSCDLQESEDNSVYHVQANALEVMSFCGPWDLMIAHPPCTYLTNTGVHWLTGKKARPGRWDLMLDGAGLFKRLWEADIPRICIENPIPHKYAVEAIGCKYTQLIQPYHFGHLETKATCLWLKNLPPLKHTSELKAETMALPSNVRQRLHYLPPSADRAKLRSKTYSGIAAAMAQQWGNL